MNTVYLIVSRYDRDEFYNIYGKGVYTDLEEAKKDWKKELKSFLSMGPDDVYIIGLVQCQLSDNELKELEDHIKKFDTEDSYEYNSNFINFMKAHLNIYDDAIYGPDGYDGASEIWEEAEDNSEDPEDDKVFTKYFNKYYRKYYK